MKHWIRVSIYNGNPSYLNIDKILYVLSHRDSYKGTIKGTSIYFSETDNIEVKEDIDTVMKMIEEAEK